MDPFKEIGVLPPDRVTFCDLVVGKMYLVLDPSIGLLREMILDSMFLSMGDVVFVAPKTQQFREMQYVTNFLSDKKMSVYTLD